MALSGQRIENPQRLDDQPAAFPHGARPWRSPCSNHRPAPAGRRTTGCDSSHERNRCAVLAGQRALRADRAAAVLRPARTRRVDRSRPIAAPPRTARATCNVGPPRPAYVARRRQQPVERERLLGVRSRRRHLPSPAAPRCSRLSRAARSTRSAPDQPPALAHTSSSPCSSSRSTSPSHRNGIVCTPKAPFSRWSW